MMFALSLSLHATVILIALWCGLRIMFLAPKMTRPDLLAHITIILFIVTATAVETGIVLVQTTQ